MKYFSMTLLFTLLICFNINAQKGKVTKGYIIDNEGNKIEGYVQIQKDEIEYMVKVRFNENMKSKKYTSFKPKDISGYGFVEVRQNNMSEDYDHVREFIKYELDRPAKLFAANTSFIEKIVDGTLEIYQFNYETAANVENPVSIRYIVLQSGEEIAQIEESKFAESSRAVFAGYTALIDSLGKLNFKFANFPRLVEDYNYWLLNKHDPATYKMNPIIFNQ